MKEYFTITAAALAILVIGIAIGLQLKIRHSISIYTMQSAFKVLQMNGQEASSGNLICTHEKCTVIIHDVGGDEEFECRGLICRETKKDHPDTHVPICEPSKYQEVCHGDDPTPNYFGPKIISSTPSGGTVDGT